MCSVVSASKEPSFLHTQKGSWDTGHSGLSAIRCWVVWSLGIHVVRERRVGVLKVPGLDRDLPESFCAREQVTDRDARPLAAYSKLQRFYRTQQKSVEKWYKR